MRVSKRRGFTLVELLIVIVIIGILAGGMMLASGSATDSAKAATALSELRSAKAAGIMWTADNTQLTGTALIAVWNTVAAGTATNNSLDKYMDNPSKSAKLVTGSSGSELYVGTTAYQGESENFYTKLKGQAGSIIFSAPGSGSLSSIISMDATGWAYGTGNVQPLWMRVR